MLTNSHSARATPFVGLQPLISFLLLVLLAACSCCVAHFDFIHISNKHLQHFNLDLFNYKFNFCWNPIIFDYCTVALLQLIVVSLGFFLLLLLGRLGFACKRTPPTMYEFFLNTISIVYIQRKRTFDTIWFERNCSDSTATAHKSNANRSAKKWRPPCHISGTGRKRKISLLIRIGYAARMRFASAHCRLYGHHLDARRHQFHSLRHCKCMHVLGSMNRWAETFFSRALVFRLAPSLSAPCSVHNALEISINPLCGGFFSHPAIGSQVWYRKWCYCLQSHPNTAVMIDILYFSVVFARVAHTASTIFHGVIFPRIFFQLLD